jgi:hypothetical protein
MRLKGFDKFRAKLPTLSGLKILFLPIYGLAALHIRATADRLGPINSIAAGVTDSFLVRCLLQRRLHPFAGHPL